MKKTAVILMGLCLIQTTNNSYAIGAPEVVAKVAHGIAGAIVKVTSTAWPTFCVVMSLYGIYWTHQQLATSAERIKKQQEADFAIASKKLIDLLVEHANEKVAELGIPEACEQAARELMLLPNGLEEFKRVVGVYTSYIKNKVSVDGVEIKRA
jgi:preprotein translocase subunit SecG